MESIYKNITHVIMEIQGFCPTAAVFRILSKIFSCSNSCLQQRYQTSDIGSKWTIFCLAYDADISTVIHISSILKQFQLYLTHNHTPPRPLLALVLSIMNINTDKHEMHLFITCKQKYMVNPRRKKQQLIKCKHFMFMSISAFL